tara:strand:- start:2437 stop:4839 length:2403 start_codon:yes stop_codon:yes gene_type:complete
MALKDLKSDLSKFRMPKKDPLVNKKVESVNKKLNQTPLSSLIKSMSDIPKPNTNPTKRGTTPSDFDNSSNFLGETNPTKFDNNSNFLGETDPSKMDNSSNFLGETNPNKFDNESNFLGETDVSNFNNSSNFLGETTPSDFNFEPNHEKTAKTPSEVNYLSDIHASGFTSKFENKDDTKFIGINPNNTIFDSTNSKFSNFQNSFPGISFTPGYGSFKLNSSSTSDTQRYNPDRKYYINNNIATDGISQLQDLNGSPSFLENAYNKFNLKDDSFNTTIPFLNHPLILRGIQKKNGSPEDYGQFGLSFDDGFIRGGTISSTTRALVDTARIGSWLLSPKGQLWSIKQVGMQRLNKSNKIWTPANLLTAVGIQHLGLKPNRSGLLPFNTPLKREGGAGEKLSKIYILDGTSYRKPVVRVGLPLAGGGDLIGGFDSFYGIGLTVTTRYDDTFDNDSKRRADEKAEYNQKFDPFINKKANLPIPGIQFIDTYEESIPSTDDEKKKFGLGGIDPTQQTNKNVKISPVVTDERNLADNTPNIKKYATIAYGNIPNREAGSTGFNDFRSLLSSNDVNNKIAKSDNYNEFNVNTRTNFRDAGKIGANRSEWWYTSKNSAENNNNDRYDLINAADIGDSELNDLVHLWFQVDGGSRIQFRGTANGITETFSPSWDSIKYNGRADQAYKYSSFERSVSFGFRVVATSRIEMKPIWNKLQQLSTYTMPTYDNSGLGYKGNLVKFRLGSLWNGKLAFIESLSYTMIDDMSWEISMLNSPIPIGELPKGVDISIGLKILDDNVPELNQKVYDFNF